MTKVVIVDDDDDFRVVVTITIAAAAAAAAPPQGLPSAVRQARRGSAADFYCVAIVNGGLSSSSAAGDEASPGLARPAASVSVRFGNRNRAWSGSGSLPRRRLLSRPMGRLAGSPPAGRPGGCRRGTIRSALASTRCPTASLVTPRRGPESGGTIPTTRTTAARNEQRQQWINGEWL